MRDSSYIKIDILCRHYQIEPTLFQHLDEMGLIQTFEHESKWCVDEGQVSRIDKILRLYCDLNINPEGIDVILNLLKRIDELECRLTEISNRLALHE
ncbi:chaperone modulator CbpM [Marinicella litoralis]|uniref:MerR family transcriptional regulator/heat shock protein HspR n=1 Tax=Marinicella litoralis TaxID=644220 RepID=A0A4R6XPU1_9GAMM|nr:chaperone modulator CbpM [Marinicella litoralis]TDR19353.1 MerR family transcriptional regulator/heat shock protein HspR [Marinicella litoralis]